MNKTIQANYTGGGFWLIEYSTDDTLYVLESEAPEYLTAYRLTDALTDESVYTDENMLWSKDHNVLCAAEKKLYDKMLRKLHEIH